MKQTIVGIDPGLAKTAVVAIENGRITLAKTITTTAQGKPTFPTVMERGMEIADRLVALLDPLWDITAVAVEQYEDMGGGHLQVRKKRSPGGEEVKIPIPNRWTTPAVCALIGAKLEMCGYTVVWQRPTTVMTAYRQHKRAWADHRTGLVPGDELLTNDHLRSAACHALAYIDAHRHERSTA